PEQFRFSEFIQHWLDAQSDPRKVVADPGARYYGAVLSERSLVPAGDARLGTIRFEDWLRQPVPQR
ncbi:MAG: NmrA family transcriptional regulator, partial [bacterium]